MEENTFGSRVKRAWNAFFNRDPTANWKTIGDSYSYRPDRVRYTRGNERSIITSIYNRIATDAASINIVHAKLDDNGRFKSEMDTGLNRCLTLEANIDQAARAFRQDIYASLMDEGCIAIVPVETDEDPKTSDSYDVLSMRVGKITEWFPKYVRVRLYNENTGKKEDVILPKSMVTIVENPFYSVMNEPNSTLQRLMRTLNDLDAINAQSASGKLDLIIQLPYIIKTDARKAQAEQRRKDIEMQLAGSKYGIAYTDGTEHITQLNRSVENNLLKHVEYLQNMLYSQLGITQAVMDGSADEATMTNYNNRTIEPLVSAVVDGMKRSFISEKARKNKESILFFREPFKLVPATGMADIADKLTRNEIMTSNEVRQNMGMKPADDPRADELVNKNISQPGGGAEPEVPAGEDSMGQSDSDGIVNDLLDNIEAQINDIVDNYLTNSGGD